jgi:hypothetical protein
MKTNIIKLASNNNNLEAIAYFKDLFCDQIKKYIKYFETYLTKIIICFPYFPHINSPDYPGLDLVLNYKNNQIILQNLFRSIFENAIKKINIIQGPHHMDPYGKPESVITHCPLFEVLDPTDSNNYVKRVEPSTIGGKLLAKRFLSHLILLKLKFHEYEIKNFDEYIILELSRISQEINYGKYDKFLHTELINLLIQKILI